MKPIFYKSADNSVLDVDDKSRVVKNVLNRTEYLDSANDIITKNAFTKTIAERGPKGKNLIYHLTDHQLGFKNVIGKFSDIYMDGDNLVGVTNIPNTTLGNDMLEMYKTGIVNQHSIGYNSIQEGKQKTKDGEINYIKEVRLLEGSAVLFGCNDATPNLSVGKSLTNLSIKEKESVFKNLIDRLEDLDKVLSKGKLSDETCELLQLNVYQIHDTLTKLFVENLNPSAEEAIDPKEDDTTQFNDEVKKTLLLLNLKLS